VLGYRHPQTTPPVPALLPSCSGSPCENFLKTEPDHEMQSLHQLPWHSTPPSPLSIHWKPFPFIFPFPSHRCESCFLTPPERLQKPIGFHAWKDRITASLRLEKTSASVENHNLGGNKMTLEEFKRPFQVNPIILPRDITCMSSKDTQKANSLTFFGTESISFF